METGGDHHGVIKERIASVPCAQELFGEKKKPHQWKNTELSLYFIPKPEDPVWKSVTEERANHIREGFSEIYDLTGLEKYRSAGHGRFQLCFPPNFSPADLLDRVMEQTCYMCDASGITDEHVPPKGLFPKLKDTIDGRDLRKQLITVPSCEEHNTKKSEADEYFVFVFTSSILANPVGEHQAATKQLRAFQLAPGKLKKFVPSWEPVTFKGQNGEIYESARTPLLKEIFDSVVDKLGRALYFHHFGEKWTTELKPLSNVLVSVGGSDDQAYNQQLALLNSVSRIMFFGRESIGENPDVFNYNVRSEAGGRRAIRANFYGDAQIAYYYSPNEL